MFRFLILLLFIPNAVADCPNDSVFWASMSMCYFFITTPQPFSQAENYCNGLGGNLASIHDSFTNAYIYSEAQSAFSDYYSSPWIGLSCISGNCSWTDGSSFAYSDFKNSSNLQGCGSMSLTTAYWNMQNCSDTRSYICERSETLVTPITAQPITTTASGSLCPSDDWYYFNTTNSCYYWTYHSDWATAEAFCVSQNSHLTSIHSKDEMNDLNLIYNGYVWVGLHADKGPIGLNTIWQWTDGSYLDYLPWQSDFDFPSVGKDYQCVVETDNSISNVNCSSRHTNYTGICKTPSSKIVSTTNLPPVQNCPLGWTYRQRTNACYLGPTPNLTQNAAENYCISRGGELASIRNNYELQFLMYATSDLNFWIGLYTKDNPVQINTTWQWTDKTNVNYITWKDGIPSLDSKLCATSAATYGSYSYQTKYAFQNADCTSTFPAICKQVPLNTEPTSNPVSTTTFKPPNPCDNIWSNSSYFIPLAQTNWTIAEEYCELCGGYLASFHSYEDLYKAVQNIFGNFQYNNDYGRYSWNYWIGLYSDNNGRKWKWIDGSVYDYANWRPGYPDQSGPVCANLLIGPGDNYYSYSGTYGMTNSEKCSENLYAICKYHSG